MDFIHKLLIGLLLLAGVGAQALALGPDRITGQRVDQLMASDQQYRQTWHSVVRNEDQLPGWVTNLTGTSMPMHSVDQPGGKYLVGELCEAYDCTRHRLYVAFTWDKQKAYALYVTVPEGLPPDQAPSRHARLRWLGEPDDAVKSILDEELKSDPSWF
ncbi:inhibitor of vertebrate lysozyme family protein [Pseudomonas nitroreducens]|uniref:inhibitor of vertebrate lysozyme family protein n=1 Tax=Pseudomonas nitroreducens TaxID=46680 RepID=UPI00351CDAD3